MLWEITRKEILGNITSPKFIFSFLLCTILILLSVYSGAINYREELTEFNAAIPLNKKNLESNQSYGTIGLYGIKVTKPPEVLSTIISGISDAVGRQANIDVRTIPALSDSKYSSNSSLAIFGELDLALIVKIVLSLFAILFTYDAISGEKEKGTLKLIMSNYVPRDRQILGKVIGCFISLLLPLIILLILGLIILNLYPDISFSGEDWMRIGLIFVLFFLYLSVFFTLGLFISSRTKTSSSSLFILLFLWVIFIVVIPKASVMIAGQIEPIPSMHEVTAQKDAFKQEMSNYYMKKIIEKFNEIRMLSGEERRKKVGEIYLDVQKDINTQTEAKYAELDEDYQLKRRKQQILAMTLSCISPASALEFGAMSLGKIGIHEHERFLNSINAYRWVFIKWKETKEGPSGIGNLEEPDFSEMPQFEFRPESLRDSFARAMPDFLIIILMSILFFIGAFVSFLRYDVR